MSVAAREVREAFGRMPDVEVNDEFVDTVKALCEGNRLTAGDLAQQWEVLALNFPKLDAAGLVRKLRDKLAKEQQRAESKMRKSLHAPIDAASPTLNKRTIKRMAGHGRRVDPSPGEGPSLAETLKRSNGVGMGGNGSKRQKGGPHDSGPSTPIKGAFAKAGLATSSSPICTAGAYADRTNMGKIELEFNKELATDPTAAAVAVQSVEIADSCPTYQYMYSTLEERAQELEEQLLEAKEWFKAAHGWENQDFAAVGTTSQGDIIVYGRICCEATKGKINAQSIVLEGSRADSNGARVKLDVESHLKSFALFPGQVVAVRGFCPSGSTLHARELFAAVPPPISVTPRKSLLAAASANGERPLSILAASGPFSTKEDFDYDPLEDLLAQIAENKPSVAILMGPFVDADHPQIISGRCKKELDDGTQLPLTYQDIFEFVLQRIATVVGDGSTKVVLVPSTKDVTHHVSFPQPAFSPAVMRDLNGAQSIMLAPNPCTLRVQDVVIGVSTVDTVMHLAQEEISKADPAKPKRPRLLRLAEHMINQRCFYPIFPANAEAHIEFTQRAGLLMETKPDILLLSSKLKHFVEVAHGSTLCVNPGKLTRGHSGGMYAKILVQPRTRAEILHAKSGRDEEAAAELAQADEEDSHDEGLPAQIVKRTKIEIIRI
ncbi:DNA polymerase alpha subunit B (DNA polymerase alpha 70 kDa subunit) [Durusdinium trenchii]|uniref:DNA polymerase alpha subunit B n=1 Tax=Durusdinium trenchii TaxID=1381693 RepID=A0ABP0QC71_9DINO